MKAQKVVKATNMGYRDKSGRFSSRKKEISDKLDTSEGRKELAEKMVGPIAKSLGLVPTSIPYTCKSSKPIAVERNKPKAKHRPTKEEIQKAKEESEARILHKRETLTHISNIATEADNDQYSFMGDMLSLSLRKSMGNARLNKERKEIASKITKALDEENMKTYAITSSKGYMKAQDKIAKKAKKAIKKIYKKAKKKYGKKIAKVIFSYMQARSFEELKMFKDLGCSKKVKELQTELEKKMTEIEQDKQIVQNEINKCKTECPKVSPEDLSLVDHSCITGKEKVKLPEDVIAMHGSVLEAANTPDEDLEDLEAMDLGELASKMP